DLPLVYHWDFGDGNTDTGATAAHLYTSDGGYTVTLTVTDARGASSPAASTAAHVQASPLVLLAAGNISSCGSNWDDLTARLLGTIPGTVMTLGDNAFPSGTATNYQNCYDPTWGRHKARTYATLGNHEYDTGAADGAFDYFGERAGARGQGYYSFNLGAWHVIVLNSNGAFVPFAAGTAQDQWLQADLAANTRKCILATWHHARFFSSSDPGFTSSAPIKVPWDRLYRAGADVVLHAYLHHYERLAPMTPDGTLDSARGIREFMVGTGGESVGMPTVIAANSGVGIPLQRELGRGRFRRHFGTDVLAAQIELDSGHRLVVHSRRRQGDGPGECRGVRRRVEGDDRRPEVRGRRGMRHLPNHHSV